MWYTIKAEEEHSPPYDDRHSYPYTRALLRTHWETINSYIKENILCWIWNKNANLWLILWPMAGNNSACLWMYITLAVDKWYHDDVIKWKKIPRYWPSVRGIHRSPVNSPHKGQRRGALMVSLICTRINGWVNNGEAGDLRRYRAHYDVTVMMLLSSLIYHSAFNPFLFQCHTHVLFCCSSLSHWLGIP